MLARIINVASNTSRMSFQRAQMETLGLEWKRLEATIPETLPVPFSDPRWNQWERPLRAAEAALFVSHCAAWEEVAASNEPKLILEDDALLAADVPAFLQRLESKEGFDHITLEVRNRKKLVGGMHSSLPIRRLYQDRTGAAAFVLWPSGARKLLARAKARAALADAIICSTYNLRSWQADPGLAIQLDQCFAYGMVSPIDASSTLTKELSPSGTAIHRLRRIVGQARMGVRQVSQTAVARRMLISLSPNWPMLSGSQT